MHKILIVDDEAQIVELLTMVLDGDERQLLPAYDGAEALEIVRRMQPHAVLSDVMMPGLDGRELCRCIKSDPALDYTPVILMSAGRSIDLGECGADAFIQKPFDISAVVDMLERFLDTPA